MEKGELLFLEPDFDTLWTIVKSSMMDIILTKKSESDPINSGFQFL